MSLLIQYPFSSLWETGEDYKSRSSSAGIKAADLLGVLVLTVRSDRGLSQTKVLLLTHMHTWSPAKHIVLSTFQTKALPSR